MLLPQIILNCIARFLTYYRSHSLSALARALISSQRAQWESTHHSLRTFVTRVDCIRYEHDRGRSSIERLQPSSGGYLILADRFDG